MRPLASSLQRRRRSTPTRISTRPRRSDASTIWSTICANPSVPDGSHVAAQVGPCKVWRQRRLLFNEVLASLSGLVPVDHKSPWMSLFAPHTVDAVAEEPVRRRGDVFAL